MGGDALDVPGWLESRDPETGDIQWKWYTTPRRGEPGIETWPNEQTAANGGGMPWQPPTYDPELNLLYVPTGNPNPVLDGRRRPGANLYTASIVALDVDTGKMAWYFQGSPHDTHDWDGTQVPVLFDAEIDGKPRKLLAQANRNGFFFVLDRTNGQHIVSKPFIETANWFDGVDKRPADSEGRQGAADSRRAGLAEHRRRGQLSGAQLQSRHRALLHQRH